MTSHEKPNGSGRPSWLRVLLVVPFVFTLWVPFYNHAEPALFGFPFFYWYQLAWVLIAALLIYIVFRAES
jgi:Protein of unknown function (DUF3311)